MNKSFVAAAAVALASIPLQAQTAPALKDQKDKVSYSIGVNIGSNFRRQGIEVNPDILITGIKDALANGKQAMSEKEMQETLMNFQQEMTSKQAEKSKVIAEKNKKEGEAFLAANKKKDGVKSTASGLQYKVITEGKGKKPTAESTVRVHYKGTLIDGTEFDSSYKRNEPAEFPLNGVIPGWTEALQLMPVGSKWQIFLPSAIGYAERGAGQDIGPNSTLIFDIELLAIVDDAKAGK